MLFRRIRPDDLWGLHELRPHVSYRGFFGGDRISLRPTLRYRIGETFSTELSWDYNDIELPVTNGDFEVNLARLRVSYSFTPKILL